METRVTGRSDEAALSAGYWHIIWRRRWLIGLFVVVTTAVVAVGSVLMTPVYEATVVLHVREQRPSILGGDLSSVAPLSSREDINTQAEILKSRSVLGQVIAELGLSAAPEGSTAVRETRTAREALDRLRRDTSVRQVPNTRLIHLSARSTDPELAARIANSIARVFIDKNVESKRAEANAVLSFVSGQVEQVRSALGSTEDELLAYKKGERIGILDQEARLMVERLAQLEASAQEAAVAVDVLDTRIAAILAQSGTGAPVLSTGAAGAPDVGPLRERLAALHTELAALEADKGGSSARIAGLREQIDSLRAQVRLQLQSAMGSGSTGALGTAIQMQLAEYESQRVVLTARQDALRSLIRSYERDIDRLPAQEIALIRLERTQRVNNELYAALMRAKNEAQVEAASQISNADIIDTAIPPLDPVRPRKSQNAAVALVASLVLGMLLALFLDTLDQTVQTEEEIRRHLSASILGVIPRFKNGASRRNGRSSGARSLFFNKSGADPGVAESFRMLAASLRLLDAKGELAAVVVTSPAPGDGKTTIAANLALALAAQDARVVLVDADFRMPRVHEVFGVSRSPGISDVFLRGAGCSEVVRHIDGPTPLDIVTCGPPLAAGTEVAASSRMAAVVNELKKSYDRIILDVPPMVGASDAVILASVADGALLVMRLGQLDRRLLRRTTELLANARVRVVGGVLNGVNPRGAGYGHYYHYHYASRTREG